jgi:hypothetical protein
MSRYVRGVMKEVHAEPGTVLGPNLLGELLVVVEDRPEGVALGFATVQEVRAVIFPEENLSHPVAPRSVTEHRLHRQARQVRQA